MKHSISLLLFCLIFGNMVAQESNTISINKNQSNTITLNTDKDAPVITILSPVMKKRGFKAIATPSKTISIVGEVKDKSGVKLLFVNGNQISFDESGLFNVSIELVEGENEITFIAQDNKDNRISEVYVLEYHLPVENQVAVSDVANSNVSDNKTGKYDFSFGRYYALIIGIDDYQDPTVTDLDKPVRDATSLYDVLLGKYAFEKQDVMFLQNPTRTQIIEALDHFSQTVSYDDNFLVFYAGHGVWFEESQIGYWLPTDAKASSKAAWFRNSALRDYISEIKSKHTLLITDACFGGSIFKSRSAFNEAAKDIKLLHDLPSRKAMTSGTLTEVPDESAFLKFLVKRLDENQENYLTAEQLFSSFRTAVINNSEVVPQYGEIKSVGDEGGDFIFVKK